MFYNIFLKVPEDINKEYVAEFDYWLATLPKRNESHITASAVQDKLKGTYYQAQYMLEYAFKRGVLNKHYVVYCPECGETLDVFDTADDVSNGLLNPIYCDECEEYVEIKPENIYSAYKVVKRPDVSEREIEDIIKKRLKKRGVDENFSEADSLTKSNFLNVCFYNPDESAYQRFVTMRNELDKDYGDNKTAKGASLEELVLEIFSSIKFFSGTTKLHSETNQYDCTVISEMDTQYPSVFNYLSPYFIIECKNEKKRPNNTYMNKLIGIVERSEAKIGILFSREKAASTCIRTAYNHYLTKQYAPKKEIIICMDDTDLKYLIDKRVNLLDYINYKICKFTNNSNTLKWEDFNVD